MGAERRSAQPCWATGRSRRSSRSRAASRLRSRPTRTGLRARFFPMQRGQSRRRRPATDGSRDERIQASWRHDSAGLLAPRHCSRFGTLPQNRPETSERRTATTGTSWPPKTCGSVASMRGQIKLEVLNVTNTVKVRGPITRSAASDLRPDPRAVRIHAPDADDVPHDVLRGRARCAGSVRAAASAARGLAPFRSGRAHASVGDEEGRSSRSAPCFSNGDSRCCIAPAFVPRSCSLVTLSAQPRAPLGIVTFPDPGAPRRTPSSSAAWRGCTALATKKPSTLSALRSESTRDSPWRTGARRCAFNQPLWFHEDVGSRGGRRWRSWRRRRRRGRRRRGRRASRDISPPLTHSTAPATKPARDKAYADAMAAWLPGSRKTTRRRRFTRSRCLRCFRAVIRRCRCARRRARSPKGCSRATRSIPARRTTSCMPTITRSLRAGAAARRAPTRRSPRLPATPCTCRRTRSFSSGCGTRRRRATRPHGTHRWRGRRGSKLSVAMRDFHSLIVAAVRVDAAGAVYETTRGHPTGGAGDEGLVAAARRRRPSLRRQRNRAGQRADRRCATIAARCVRAT